MKTALKNLILVLGTAAIIVFPGSAPRADDTEIYVGSNLTNTVQPNVVFIIDTSGSMGTYDVPTYTNPYDPATDYSSSGTCNSSYVYWSSTGKPPSSCSTSHYFLASKNTCADSATALGSSGTGYYVSRLARYRTSSWGDRWYYFSSTVHDDYVECQADYGVDGDGVDTTKLYPANGNNGGPWTATSSKAITWSGTGRTYTLYSANYMNWYTTVSGVSYAERLAVVQQAFSDLINSTSGVNAAVMRYSQNGQGGYFVSKMQPVDSSTRSSMISAVNAFTPNGYTPLAETLYESSLFYRGQSVDFGDSSTPGTNVSGVLDSSDTSKYQTPIKYQCQKNFVVVLTDGEPTQDTSADSNIEALTGFKTITGSSTCSGDCLDELAQWMYNSDLIDPALNDKQNVITYTIGLNLDVQLLDDTAKKGGGKYYTASSATDIANAFTSIITQVLQTNTTFIAPAVTVNAFNRLTHRDDLYFSVFKPNGTPDWRGNVKHYKLAGNPPIIVDANNAAAIDANTGFFSGTSTSIWTLAADAPDGDDVEKGGAAGLLTTSRTIYTYTGSSPNNEPLSTNTADIFNESNTALTIGLLGMPGSATETQRQTLLKWARGVDIFDVNENGVTTDARRQMGDVLHSKPVLLTYGGTDANPDITMFVGDNEGFIHALNAIDGTEQFAFIPKDLLGNLYTLYNNSATDSHPYGMDGPLTLWHNDVNGDHLVLNTDNTVQTGEFVYLYAGMRRGGDNYYAFDVTDRAHPVLKWQITGGSGDFADLGQTWSRPVATKIKFNGVDRNVLIFGGGYDTNQDANTLPSADSTGDAIYIVDADTGQRLWWASSDTSNVSDQPNLVLSKMTNSIPSDPAVIDIDNDGLADYLFVGDMGGRIWRIDFNKTNTGATNLAYGGLLAELGGTDAANNRRFYYAPDVALIRSNGGYALSVSIGSGYRAHPLNQTIQDRFYMIRDDNAFSAPPDTNSDLKPDYPDYTEADLYDATTNDLGQTTGATLDAARTALSNAHGWYIRLVASDGTTYEGEKVLAESVTADGKVNFTTFTPVASSQTNSCAPSQGVGKSYTVNLLDATPAFDTTQDGQYLVADRAETLKRTGIPPEPTFIFSGDKFVKCVGTECDKDPPKPKMFRSYWYQN
jgi:type IV pilus assembly protein PilY1